MQIEASFSELIGRSLQLKEMPDSSTSSQYNVKVGKSYKIIDMYGSCFVIMDDDGTRAYIYHGRFDLSFLN